MRHVLLLGAVVAAAGLFAALVVFTGLISVAAVMQRVIDRG